MLAADGYEVFQVRPGEKRPAITGFPTEATTDSERIKAWWDRRPDCNIGVSTSRWRGRALLVVDVDPKRGGDELLTLDSRDFPPTRTHKTGSGGQHLIYAVDVPVKQGHDVLGKGLDVRSYHGYIVGPGSVTDAGTYEVQDSRPIADAPAWVIEECGKPSEREPGKCAVVANLDEERAKRRAEYYLRVDAPIAIEGEGGDYQTLDVFYYLGDLGIKSEVTAGALALDLWNGRCVPPWSADDLMVKAANAYRYRDNPIGCAAPEAHFTPLAPAPADGPEPFSALLRAAIEPVEELIPGIIEKGIVNALDGPGGSHKSRLALQWALCVSAGVPVFNATGQKATAVFLSSEDARPEIVRRSQAITTRLDLPRDHGAMFWDMTAKSSVIVRVGDQGSEYTDFHKELVAYLKSIAGHKFVVLDSTFDFVRFMGHSKVNEDAVNELYKVVLTGICRESDSTMLVIRHPSKAGTTDGTMEGWSVANTNSVRSRLSLAPVADTKDAYILTVKKRNHGPDGAEWTLFYSDGALVPRDALADSEQSSRAYEAVIQTAVECAAGGEPFTQQRNPLPHHIDRVAELSGVRLTVRELKDKLSLAVRCGKLKYQKGHGRKQAGYFPISDG